MDGRSVAMEKIIDPGNGITSLCINREKVMKHYDEIFIRQCRLGDKKSQRQLFDELYPWMFRVVYRYTALQAEAEDCVMKGFMKAFQNIGNFRYEGTHSIFVWIRRIMVNEALMFLRQRHNFMLSIESVYTETSVRNEALNRIDAEDLNALILRLPTGYRTVFNMYVVEGYDHKEIAGILGVSENTSRTQLAKARNKLRLMLGQNKFNHGNYGR